METKADFSPKARKAGKAARKLNMDERRKLAVMYKLRPSDFFRDVILDTVKVHNIPMSAVPAALIPRPMKKPAAPKTNGKSTGKWASLPLDAIPEPPRKYVKKLTKAPVQADNTLVILRLLDLIERLL